MTFIPLEENDLENQMDTMMHIKFVDGGHNDSQLISYMYL